MKSSIDWMNEFLSANFEEEHIEELKDNNRIHLNKQGRYPNKIYQKIVDSNPNVIVAELPCGSVLVVDDSPIEVKEDDDYLSQLCKQKKAERQQFVAEAIIQE